MGRFYQTTDPQLIDYVYKPPIELMEQVIKSNDDMIDKSFSILDALPEAIKAQAIEGVDKDRLQAYTKEKQAKIDEITKAIRDNPLEARTRKQEIFSLAHSISKDVTGGELAYLSNNKKSFDTWFEEQKKRMYGKDEYVTAEDIANKKAVLLKQWNESGGTGFNQGIGNSFSANPLASAVNLQKEALTIGKEVKPDQYSNVHFDEKTGQYKPLGNTLFQSSDPAYLTKYANTIKVLNEDKVAAAVTMNLMNRPDVMNYYKQKMKDAHILGQKYSQEDVIAEIVSAAQVAGKTLAFHEEDKKETLHTNLRYMDNLNFQQDIAKIKFKDSLDDKREEKKKKEENALGTVASLGVFQVPTNQNLVAMKTSLDSKRQQLQKLKSADDQDPSKIRANNLNINLLEEQIKNDENQLIYAGNSVPFDFTGKYNEFKANVDKTTMLGLGGVKKPISQMTEADFAFNKSSLAQQYSNPTAKQKEIIQANNDDIELAKKLQESYNNPTVFTNNIKTSRVKDSKLEGTASGNSVLRGVMDKYSAYESEFSNKAKEVQPVLKEEALALVPVKGSVKESESYNQLKGYLVNSVFKNITAFDVIDAKGNTTQIGDSGKIPVTNANGKTIQMSTTDLLASSPNTTVGQYKLDGKTVTVVKFVDKEGNFKGTANLVGRTEDQEAIANSVYGTIAKNLINSDDEYVRTLANNAIASTSISNISRNLRANRMVEGQSNSYTDGHIRYNLDKDKSGKLNVKIQEIDDSGNYNDATDKLVKLAKSKNIDLNLSANDSKGLDKIIYLISQLTNNY